MKINTESAITKSNAIGTSTSFKIKTSATAFKILSEGLYSNKIGSMIRELICNAYDAHCAAGTKDTPIDIELPMVTNPVFRIRDYGTGLSEDDMRTIYTTYFESTKSDDNKYIGGFGLGSKTPLCYNTEQFFVTSYFNGKKFVYNVAIGDTGAPVLTKWEESHTEEPNGLELTISVDVNDTERFKLEFYKFLIWSDIKINRIGYDEDFNRVGYKKILPLAEAYCPQLDALTKDRTIPPDVLEYASDLFDGSWNTKGGVVVRVGEVVYFANYRNFFDAYDKIVPDYVNEILIEAERVSGVYDYDKAEFIKIFFGSPDKLRDIVRNVPPICLKVNIGDIEVTASREDISYTEETLKTLSIKLFGVLCGCALKAMSLTVEFMETGDPEIYLSNPMIVGYTKDNFFSRIATNTERLLLKGEKKYDLSLIRKQFKQITDGFDVPLNDRLDIIRCLLDQTSSVYSRAKKVSDAVCSASVRSCLAEYRNISISSLDWCAFKKTDDAIRSVFAGNSNPDWVQVKNGNIKIVVSRLKPEEALQIPNFGQFGIDTTGCSLYLWARVSSKIAGEKLIAHLASGNQLPHRMLNFKIISFIGGCNELAYKIKTSARKVPCGLFNCERDNKHGWKVTEDYQADNRDGVAERLQNGDSVYVLPVCLDAKSIRNSVSFFEEKLPFLLNLLPSQRARASIAVVPSSNCAKFKSKYGKLGDLVVMTDRDTEVGKALMRVQRHSGYFITERSQGIMYIIGLFERQKENPSKVYSWEEFFTNLCLEVTPHLKRRSDLYGKMLGFLGARSMNDFYNFVHLLSFIDLPKFNGKKFYILDEVSKVVKKSPIERLRLIAARIEQAKITTDYQAASILIPVMKKIIKRLLDNQSSNL